MEQRGILLVGKNLILISLLTTILNATEYFSKIEPYESHTINSEVSGKVVFVDKSKEYSFIDSKSAILKLDTKDENIQLTTLKNSLAFQKESVKIKESNYKNKAKVKQLSIYNKNQEKLYFLEAKQTLENIKRDIKTQQNQIDKKQFFTSNKYLAEILVSLDEYVESGTKLYTLYDFSKSKLELFVKVNDLENLKEKNIFIDDNLSDFKVEKISQVRDEKRVSTYKVILSSINKSKNFNFGKVVKVEFR